MKKYMKNFDENKLKEAFRIKDSYAKGELPLDMANAQMKAHVGTITATELAYIEQHFNEKADDECIKENLEEMLAIYDGVLIEEEEELPENHPIKNYLIENQKIREIIKNMDVLLTKKYIKNEWDEQIENLNRWKIHLSRKQNQLYPALEKKGFDRPTTTMWLYDNDVRDKITELSDLTKNEFTYENIKETYKTLKEHLFDLMEKEETVLYPTSLQMLSEEDFVTMSEGDYEIGFCLIFPKPYKKTLPSSNEETAYEATDFNEELSKLLSKYNMGGWTKDTPMDVAQGILSLNQINLIFKHLPVDISYVDENELVAFYSDTEHRVFPRSKGVIGRKVQNCHPSSSVAIVEEIISKFRSGEKDRAEFWINKPGIFIYILYVAVRDENGTFKGVMEMMQDCTKIRELEGSRTLLSWEEEEKKEEISEDQKEETTDEKITVLTPDTKLETLLRQYPGLKDYMVNKSDKFKMMNSPMFQFMKKIATVKMISEKTEIPMEVLQEEFTKYINSL